MDKTDQRISLTPQILDCFASIVPPHLPPITVSVSTPPSPLSSNSHSDGGKTPLGKRWLGPVALLSPAGLWLLVLLVLPTLVIFEISLVPNINPGMKVIPSGFDNYLLAFDPRYLKVVFRSLLFALGTTGLCLLFGFPVAYWIAILAPSRWRNLLLMGFILPLWTSSLLRSYAWVTILRPTGVLNTVLGTIGLPGLELLNRPTAVLIGMSYDFLPYMVLILYSSLEKLDPQLLEASADLGATPPETFWKITVPQTAPGIAAGSLLVFISSLGDFVDPELLGGTSSGTIARLIYDRFLGQSPNWGFGSALSTILILAVSVSIALLLKYGDRDAQP